MSRLRGWGRWLPGIALGAALAVSGKWLAVGLAAALCVGLVSAVTLSMGAFIAR
jgi:hypothetical protein